MSHVGSASDERPNRPPTLPAKPFLWCIAAITLVFAAAASEFLSAEHRLDQILLFGLPTPFDARPVASMRLNHLAHDISSLGSPPIVALISCVIAGFVALLHRATLALFFLACVSGGAAFAYLIKGIFDALRPHHEAGVMLNTSFPSGHTMLAAILYFALAALVVQVAPQSRRVVLMIYACVVATALTGAVGLSRIYLALHWPSDVLAGFAAGVGWVMICWVIFEWLHIPLVPHRDSAGRT